MVTGIATGCSSGHCLLIHSRHVDNSSWDDSSRSILNSNPYQSTQLITQLVHTGKGWLTEPFRTSKQGRKLMPRYPGEPTRSRSTLMKMADRSSGLLRPTAACVCEVVAWSSFASAPREGAFAKWWICTQLVPAVLSPICIQLLLSASLNYDLQAYIPTYVTAFLISTITLPTNFLRRRVSDL